MRRGERFRVVAVDFDGVLMLNEEPVEGARGALKELVKRGYRIVVFTARPELLPVVNWLGAYGFGDVVSSVTNGKPAADLYIDDNAVQFVNWPDTLATARMHLTAKEIDEALGRIEKSL